MNSPACALTGKKCVPCEGGVPPLSREQIEPLAAETPEWQITGTTQIERDFSFKNFRQAMVFVNAVAALAEDEGHHPDILVHNWKYVRCMLSTHAIGGLSENDFIVAAKIDNLYAHPR